MATKEHEIKQETEQDRGFRCKYCGQIFETFQELGVHSRKCEARLEALKKEEERGPPSKPVYKEEADATKILREILEGHPDIPPRVAKEVLSWAHLKGQLHPFEVAHLLNNMRGVTSSTASIVSQKYSVALSKAMAEGKAEIKMPLAFTIPQGQQLQMPSFPYVPSPTVYPPSYGQPAWTPQQPSPYAPPSWQRPQQPWQAPPWQKPIDPEDLIRRASERVAEDIRKSVDDRLSRVEARLEAQPRHMVTEEREEEVWEPVFDEKGRLWFDDKGQVVYKRRLIHPKKSGLSLEDVRRVVKEEIPKEPELTAETVRKIVKEETKPEPLTPEKVREIIREEAGKPRVGESPELKRLEEQLKEADRRYQELKATFEAKEKERLENTLTQLQSRIETLRSELASRPSGVYKSDEMLFLGTALNRFADVLEKKKPVDTLTDLLTRAPALQPGVQVPPEARKGIIQQLRERGLTVPA